MKTLRLLWLAVLMTFACSKDSSGPVPPPPSTSHDPSVLVTSGVTSGEIRIHWAAKSGAVGDTVLASPIAAPGRCVRFLVPTNDSAFWHVEANDSVDVNGTGWSTWSSGWFATDSLPAWTLDVRSGGSNNSPILRETLTNGPTC